jgi:Rho GTPase-activating protein 1
LCLALKRTDQVDVIRDLIIEKLPTQNYNVLKYLIEFLNLVRQETNLMYDDEFFLQVANYSDTNLMTTSNLSVVFGPNLAWSEEDQMNTLANYALINTFTEILISRYTELFLK